MYQPSRCVGRGSRGLNCFMLISPIWSHAWPTFTLVHDQKYHLAWWAFFCCCCISYFLFLSPPSPLPNLFLFCLPSIAPRWFLIHSSVVASCLSLFILHINHWWNLLCYCLKYVWKSSFDWILFNISWIKDVKKLKFLVKFDLSFRKTSKKI